MVALGLIGFAVQHFHEEAQKAEAREALRAENQAEYSECMEKVRKEKVEMVGEEDVYKLADDPDFRAMEERCDRLTPFR